MNDCLVVGRPNVGKTCFVVNFADYMGLEKLKVHIKQPAGYTSIKNFEIEDARHELISNKPNFTKNIQIVKLEIPAGKVTKTLKIIDSCGLKNGIHPERKIRKAMAATISKMENSNLILHIIDIKNLNPEQDDFLLPVDRLILNFSRIDKNYVVLINKTDLKEFRENINLFKNNIDSSHVIPISAVYQKNFKEVKRVVLEYV